MLKNKQHILLALVGLLTIVYIGVDQQLSLEKETTKSVFEVVAHPVEIVSEDGYTRMKYVFLADNISEQDINDVEVFLNLDSHMKDYLVTGIVSIPLGKYTLVSKEKASQNKNVASGIMCSHSPLVRDDIWESQDNLLSDLLKTGAQFSVNFIWEQGQETHHCTVDILNKADEKP